jgi:L-iditol 2-dehydrogenase
MGGDEMTLPVSRIQERELTLTGTFRYAHTWPAAVALAASGRVQLDRLVTGHYGLDRVEEALSVGRTDVLAVKPVVRPGGRRAPGVLRPPCGHRGRGPRRGAGRHGGAGRDGR